MHETLPHGRCTRVLELLEDSPIVAELSLLELDSISKEASPNDYNALSYTWDSPFSDAAFKEEYAPQFDKEISVSGHKVKIRKNLYEALSAIWRIGQRRLWVDALCINQNDNVEKSQQVQLMGDIYSRARMTIVWYGIDDVDKPTFKHVKWLGRLYHNIKQLERRMGFSLSWKIVYDKEEKDVLGMVDEVFNILLPTKELVSFYRFLARRRYYSRAWVAQEVILSSDARALLGDELIAISEVHALHFLSVELTGNEESFKSESGDTTGDTSEFGNLSMLSNRVRSWDTDHQAFFRKLLQRLHGGLPETEWAALLENGLIMLHPWACTDPRDAIYALFAYLSTLCKDFPLTPDYSADAHDIYISVTTTLLKNLPFYTILSSVCGSWSSDPPEHSKRLPSWVPDYDRCRNRDTFLKCSMIGGLLKSSCSKLNLNEDADWSFPCFAACMDGPNPPSIDERQLSLYARRVDRLMGTSKHPIEAYATLEKYTAPNSKIYRGYGSVHSWFGAFHKLVEMCLECGNFSRVQHSASRQRTLFESLLRVICSPSPLLGHNVNFREAIQRALTDQLRLAYVLRKGCMNNPKMETLFTLYIERTLEYFEDLQGDPCVPEYDDITYAFLRHWMIDTSMPVSEDESNMLHGPSGDNPQMYYANCGTTVFVTEIRYLGRVDNDAKPGDELWLIGNARFPFVLRPVDGKYILIGEALVDEVMEGELLRDGVAGEREWITVV